jgi:hypothetical protein
VLFLNRRWIAQDWIREIEKMHARNGEMMSPNEIVVTVRVSPKAAEPLEPDESTLIWDVMESEIAKENGIVPARGNVSLRVSERERERKTTSPD